MNKLSMFLVGAILFASFSHANNADLEARLARLEALVQQQQQTIGKQQQELQALRGSAGPAIGTQMRVTDDRIRTEVKEALAELGPIKLGKNVDQLALKNDARFRYQRDHIDGSSSNDIEKLRLRLRLGGIYTNKAEDWKFALGLEVGSSSHDSANTTYNKDKTFQSLSVYLDYAYAQHSWETVDLTVGQMKNPFTTTNMLWDSDIRPVGVALSYDNDGLFATLAGFDAHRGSSDTRADALFVGGQIGFEAESEAASWGAAIGYLAGNEAVDHYLADQNGNADYDSQIGDIYAWASTDVGEADVKVFAHAATNFGADGDSTVSGELAEDNDFAWSLGGQVKVDKFKFKYAYKHIEADAIIADLTDSDFGSQAGTSAGNTNVKGHSVGAGYKLNKNVELSLTGLFYEDIEGDTEADLYQLDLKYKF